MAAEDAVGRHGVINVTAESELEQFFYWYRPYHGYVAVAVCVLGIVANSANMVVLTRPSMRSPINYILSGLALSDWLTMLAYVPFALVFYILYGVEMSVQRNTWSAAQFLLFYARFSVVVHIAAIWLTVVLAMFRYIIIRFPQVGVVWCNRRRAKLAVVLVFVTSVIVCIPNSIAIAICRHAPNATTPPSSDNSTTGEMWIVALQVETDVDRFIYSLNFCIQAIVKLGPCLVLTVLSALLVRSMRQADARLRTLESGSTRQQVRRQRATNRTTRMLLAIVVLFLITEMPQGVVMIFSGLDSQFTERIYLNLGDLFDILTLVNSAVNFLLFCTMSRQFRKTFVVVFCRRSQHVLVSRSARSGRMYEEQNC